MTERFVTYNNSYGYGLYLSKPGINATTNPDPANFLLHSNVKEEQVLTAGYAGIGPNSSAFIGFPTVMPSPPLLWMNFSTVGFGIQSMPFSISIPSAAPSPQTLYAVTAVVTTSGVTFINHITNLTVTLQYIVLARGG